MSRRGTCWRFPDDASPWYVWSLHRLVWEFVPTLQSSIGEAVLDRDRLTDNPQQSRGVCRSQAIPVNQANSTSLLRLSFLNSKMEIVKLPCCSN